MASKPSSNRYSPDSSTNSSAGPKEAEDQTAESGFGEEPSFQVSVSEQVAGGENNAVQYIPFSIPVEDQTELYSEECQGYERLIKKAATVSIGHESAGYTQYLIDMNKKLDVELCKKGQLLKTFERRIKDLQLQAHLKEIEIRSLRQQMADTEQENDRDQVKIEQLQREVNALNILSMEEEKKKRSFELYTTKRQSKRTTGKS